uniref:Uncharacterized protein n=1 Tax=Accipiter nisus TaxID=211598 RepID=A0A8B9S007_9AVES
MPPAKKGAVKWLSAIPEEYTIPDHKWIHGVRQGLRSASAPAWTKLSRLMGHVPPYPPAVGQKIQGQRLAKKTQTQPKKPNHLHRLFICVPVTMFKELQPCLLNHLIFL